MLTPYIFHQVMSNNCWPLFCQFNRTPTRLPRPTTFPRHSPSYIATFPPSLVGLVQINVERYFSWVQFSCPSQVGCGTHWAMSSSVFLKACGTVIFNVVHGTGCYWDMLWVENMYELNHYFLLLYCGRSTRYEKCVEITNVMIWRYYKYKLIEFPSPSYFITARHVIIWICVVNFLLCCSVFL